MSRFSEKNCFVNDIVEWDHQSMTTSKPAKLPGGRSISDREEREARDLRELGLSHTRWLPFDFDHAIAPFRVARTARDLAHQMALRLATPTPRTWTADGGAADTTVLGWTRSRLKPRRRTARSPDNRGGRRSRTGVRSGRRNNHSQW